MSAALPTEASFDHKSKNPGVYRSRVKYFSTNQNSYTPKSTVKIEIDSTRPASFIATEQTRLDFTVVVTNSNPFIDYINLPRCGWNSIFKEYRLIVGGTALVNNKDYAYSMEQLMIKQNRNPDPVHLFLSNPWTPPEGETSVNFIKPSMIDRTGNYMYGRFSFNDQNPFNFIYFSNYGATTPAQWQTNVIRGIYADTCSMATLAAPVSVDTAADSRSNTALATGYWPAGVTSALNETHRNSALGVPRDGHNDDERQCISIFGYYPPGVPQTFYASGKHYGSGIATEMTNQPVSTTYAFGGEGSSGSAAIGNRIQFGSLTQLGYVPNTTTSMGGHRGNYGPGCWPIGQPSSPASKLITRNRNQDGASFYSNYKSIPVGLGATAFGSLDDYVFNTSLNLASYTSDYNFEFRVSTEIQCGLIGSLADKWFPESLCRGKKLWLEFDLIEARQAFSVTMDPCRRVPSTVRDFVPYTGRRHNKDRFGIADVEVHDAIRQTALYLPGYEAASADAPTTATGGGNIDPVTGATITGANMTGLSLAYAIAGATYNKNAAQGLAGQPRLHIPPGPAATAKWGNTNAEVYPIGIEAPHYAALGSAGNVTVHSQATGWIPVSIMNGFPMPQYVPVQKPWAAKGTFLSGGATTTVSNGPSYYVNEAQVCYGTYLPASVPQTKRTMLSSITKNGTGLDTSIAYYSSYGSGGITYSVTGFELVLELMTFPDELNRAIIERASSGSLSYDTRCIGTCYNNLPATDNQQVLLPVIGASIKYLLVSFRSSEAVYTDNAYLYNSYACYNPYAALKYTAATDYHVGGTYSLTNYLTTQQNLGINMRLKIGSDEYPINPINSVPELLYENEKGVSSIGNRRAIIDYEPTFIPYRRDQSSVTTNQIMEYSCQESGFYSVFTPVDCLDDQTITGNPFFNLIERSEKLQLRGLRCGYVPDVDGFTGNPVSTKTTSGVWNIFTPLDGCFQLAFLFDTFLDLNDTQCGLTIVNNQCFWVSNKVALASHTVSGQATAAMVHCVWEMNCRIQFEAGGNVMAFF